jgi:hypothetical protein
MGLILGVVVINVGIGLFQEGKAEKVRQALSSKVSCGHAAGLMCRGSKLYAVMQQALCKIAARCMCSTLSPP